MIVFLRDVWEDWLTNDCQPNYWKPGVCATHLAVVPGSLPTYPSFTGEGEPEPKADQSVKLRVCHVSVCEVSIVTETINFGSMSFYDVGFSAMTTEV